MAITQNTYTGNGSTVLFSFTFPYLETTDIKVTLDGTLTTAYTLANATTIQFNTAPGSGVAIRIYRVTDDAALTAQFYPGSAIRSQDLNDNFTQLLYVTQESDGDATDAITAATAALAAATAAAADATSALSTANTASSVATSALGAAADAAVDAAAAAADAAAAAASAASADAAAASALAAVADVLPYTTVLNVAAIPGAPADGDVVEVLDSTGIEGFTPLTGLPGGFVGDSGLRVKISYDAGGVTWEYISYLANDPDGRYEAADATILKDADIGVTVQGYDPDTAKLDVAQIYTAQQTFGELKETVYTLGTTGSIALDPANGSIQSSVLTGAPTFTDSLEAGQTVVLMLEGGATYTVTWPTITWVTSAGNAAPTLTAKDTLVLWKVSTTLYGAYVGSYV